jgi:hypothetical protein
MACAPDAGPATALPPPRDWTPPGVLMTIGALWLAWREMRRA